MRALVLILVAALATLAFAVTTAGSSRPSELAGSSLPPLRAEAAEPVSGPVRTAAQPPIRVGCERPRTLRLRRFEDRSARLECAGRLLVRVSVPG